MGRSSTTGKLHSDVLAEKYGPISAHVLRHDSHLREAHLVDANGVSRTYALTFFPKRMPGELKAIDRRIRQGGLVGAEFRTGGYEVRRNVIDAYALELPEWLRKDFRTGSNRAKARLSQFYVRKPDEPPHIYGDVVEVYSPDFLLPQVTERDLARINPEARSLQRAGFGKDAVWDRLGNENAFDNVSWEKLHAVRQSSLKRVFELRAKIERHLLTPH